MQQERTCGTFYFFSSTNSKVVMFDDWKRRFWENNIFILETDIINRSLQNEILVSLLTPFKFQVITLEIAIQLLTIACMNFNLVCSFSSNLKLESWFLQKKLLLMPSAKWLKFKLTWTKRKFISNSDCMSYTDKSIN